MSFAEYHIVGASVPIQDSNLAANKLLFPPCFVEAILTVKEGVVVLKNESIRSLVAKIRCLQYTNFMVSAQGTYFQFSTEEFRMVGHHTVDLEKPQNCQNWGEGHLHGNGQLSVGGRLTTKIHISVRKC